MRRTPDKREDNVYFVHRPTGELRRETAEMDAWLYGTGRGRTVLRSFLLRPVSRLYGRFADSFLSRLRVHKFVRKYDIELSDFEGRPYRTLNQLFTRRYRDGVRQFTTEQAAFPVPAEGRCLVYPDLRHDIRVKGATLSAGQLLQDEQAGEAFQGGSALVVRLTGQDYHRIHFPVDCSVSSSWSVPGRLDSVHPHATRTKDNILLENRRDCCLLETENFGRIALAEVGGLLVGSIVQTFEQETGLTRGEEKSYFRFGGSTVVVLFQQDMIAFDEDLVQNSRRGLETWVPLGETIGMRP